MDRKWWTLLAVCAGVFMLVVDITIVNVALPDIQRRFDASLAELQWVIDAYTLTLAALLLTAGSIADLVGRRRVFAVGLVVFSVGSALCGAAPDATSLVLARVLQGIGGAVIFATSLALLADAFAPSERGAAFAVWGAVLGVAAAMGPVLGGVITSGLSWRWVFFISVPVGILALAVTLTRVRESRAPAAARLDWPGFLTFSAGLGALILGLIRSHADGWGSATVIASLAAAAVLLVAFVLVESRSRAPMLDLRLLRVPTFGGGLIAAWSLNASIYSLFTFVVLYLQNVLGATPVETGLRLFAMTGAMFVSSAVAGRLTNGVPIRWLIGCGFALVGAGLLLMRGLTADDAWTHLLPGLITAGLGVGLVTVPLASTAVGVVEPARAGLASGINSTLRMVGLATGVAALGSILATRVDASVSARVAGGPLAAHGHELASAVSDGRLSQALLDTPVLLRALAATTARAGFVDALNEILAIGAIIAFVAAALSAVLIRQRDFAPAPSPATAAS
jgi:EmrB/QacA subfamily drug resistance transporter